MFVAEMGSQIVGFVAVLLDHEKKIGEIGLNAVHPDHAGQGIGTRLYAFAVDRIRHGDRDRRHRRRSEP